MTLTHLLGKLRKKNWTNYKQIIFCITLASALISCMLAFIFSPYMQKRLPAGGDSKKQIYMILGIALIGCFIFMIYAANIFLRYKSREIGIFMALGTQKNKLFKAFITEISFLAASCSFMGIIIGNLLSFIIGKGFERIINSTESDTFTLSITGLIGAILFCFFATSFIIITSFKFIMRTSLMDILNDQRKCEPIQKMVNTKYFIRGLFLLIIGIFGGLILPSLAGSIWKRNLGILPYAFYIFLIIGIYRILVFSVSVHKRGNHPQKYYKNLISYGMLKFQGASVVKNMLIITLLIAAGLFAFFYSPTLYIQSVVSLDKITNAFHYTYLENADMITEERVNELANSYDLKIEDYRTAHFIRLLGSGVVRDNYDSNGKLIEAYQERVAYMEFISEGEYNRITGQQVSVEEGTYKYISYKENTQNFWFLPNDLDRVENEFTGQILPLSYDGVVYYNDLFRYRGSDGDARYVISDADFLALEKNLPKEMRVSQILFNVNNLAQSYEFAKTLFQEYCASVSDNMKVIAAYDEYIESTKEEYDPFYSERITLFPDRPEIDIDWKYNPSFKIIKQKSTFLSFASFYLLFLFVAVICFTAVGIIGYTRSTTIALKNKQVYEDIRKLGANPLYIYRLLKGQIKNIYVLPTIIGVCIMFFYYFLMLWQNDGFLLKSELLALIIDFAICILACIYQYIIYQISMKKAKALI